MIYNLTNNKNLSQYSDLKETNFDLLIRILRKLPGIGPKSAKRLAFNLCGENKSARCDLANTLLKLDKELVRCDVCMAIMLSNPCHICKKTKNKNYLCVIEHISDMLAIEEANIFQGFYHCLGGIISAHNGIFENDLTIKQLVNRCMNNSYEEIIFALPLTVDGRITLQYISNEIKEVAPTTVISQLAHGIPAGAEIDFIDENTLSAAFSGRTNFKNE